MTFTSQFQPLSFPRLGLVRIPEVTITPEVRSLYSTGAGVSNTDIFKRIVWKGYQERRAAGRFEGQTEATVVDRLKVEFSVFAKTGIIDYLLVVWDFVNWCDTNGIPRGPGRGSVAGSLACFCCGIVRVNPLRHNLNFTRFISEARAKPIYIDGVLYASGKSMCDIDCDISYSKRDKVLAYLDQKYPGRTAKISNRLELTGKMALKDTLKTYLNYGEDQAIGVSSNIEAIFGKVETLTEALERHPELMAWTKRDPRNLEAYHIARQLEGLGVARGVHASGVFISYHPIDGNIPTELSKAGETVTSYDMNVVAELGVKLDCLALKTVDVIDDTCRLVGIRAEDIDVNHPSIYSYLSSTDQYYGLFQIESGVTKDVVSRLGPRHIDDLAASLAIGRPGSLKYKDDLIAYVKTGKRKTIYPPLDEILTPTGGIIIYQESINEVCQRIYGMSAVDSDEVRRAIGKKVREDMAKWEPVLHQNGAARGVPKAVTDYFWQTCNASADYLFSANHCYAYTYITAQTVYLKANHRQAFMLSLFRMAGHEANTQECLSQLMSECGKIGVSVLPPDITRSGADFELETDDIDPTKQHIRFGLAHIRGVSEQTMIKLTAFRRQFKSKLDIFDAAREAGVPINVVVSLINSGCLSWPDTPRSKLCLESQTYNLLSDTQKGKLRQFIEKHDGDVLATLKALPTIVNEKGKPVIAASQLDTLRRHYEPYWNMYLANSRNEELNSLIHERHYLGFSYSSTLFRCYSRKIVGLTEVADVVKRGKEIAAIPVEDRSKGRPDPIQMVCFVEEGKLAFSRKGNTPYWRANIYDDSGSFLIMCYGPERIEACKRANDGELPKAGDIITVEGGLSKDGGILFADTIVIQTNPIKLKRGSPSDDTPV